MRYGHFHGPDKEYVITKPDTPAPWANYLGSPEYGAIISNNAGGYSFVKSGADGRIIRYRFNSVPTDQPGRYIYVHDRENADYWSASWQPVGKPLERYQSECRHGTGYTILSSTYDNIHTETLYYVPLDKTYEVWRLKVKNNDSRPRKLALFGYVEFTNISNYEQDTVNLQYSQYITKTRYQDNMILQSVNDHLQAESRFFGMTGGTVDGYDGDREVFVGNYRNYANPESVVKGQCAGALNFNGNSCGALQSNVELAPGEEKELIFLLGAYAAADAAEIMAHYAKPGAVDEEHAALKTFWHSKLDRFQVHTPDDNFNQMVNVWNAYQCFITFIWSRAASFQYCGLRNGLGYRDTVQDIQGIIHLDHELASGRLRLMLSAQVSNGGGLPLVTFNHRPGYEGTPDDPEYVQKTGHPSYRADDALWLFPTTVKYLKESGNWSFVDEVIPYSDKGEDTVYLHLKRALHFSLERMGVHGMPVGLHADWNDCLRLGAKGESLFVAFQLYMAYRIFIEIAERKQQADDVAWAEGLLAELDESIQKHAWEEDQFVRGFTEDNYTVGSRYNEEASVWLNPQSWAVLSGAARPEQAELAMNRVHDNLKTDYGTMLFYPPFKKYGMPVALMILFNETTKENAGIFSQPQGWLIRAETLLGHGNRAFEYFRNCSPASMNDHAEQRKIEPYVHGQFVEGKDSPYFGRAHVHWLTGTASTVMVALTEGIMGVQPEFDGLRLNPCIPADWKQFSMVREFRGKLLTIEVDNPEGVEHGVTVITVNGQELPGDFIPEHLLREENDVRVRMG